MAKLTVNQIGYLAVEAGIKDPKALRYAIGIALAESGGRTDDIGDQKLANSTWGPSVGLWQIRSLRVDKGTGRTRDEVANLDPKHNARAMVEISGGGQNFHPWSVFHQDENGKEVGDGSPRAAFQKFMPQANTVDITKLGPVDTVEYAIDKTADATGLPNPLAGLEAVGEFFGKLLDPHLWWRILQIVVGFGAMVAGLLILNRDLIVSAAGKLPVP